jgi:hypothetical protein
VTLGLRLDYVEHRGNADSAGGAETDDRCLPPFRHASRRRWLKVHRYLRQDAIYRLAECFGPEARQQRVVHEEDAEVGEGQIHEHQLASR